MPKRLKLIILIFIAFIMTAVASFAILLRMNYVVPVLMYHRVLPEPDPKYKLAVSVRSFERQMKFLHDRHYNVVSIGELADILKKKSPIPRDTVAITFDDGYIDNYLYAFPILKKYGLKATLFVIVNEVGRVNSIGIRDRVNWEEISEMQRSGLIEIGSHTLGSDPLDKIGSDEELRKQIFDSRKVLEHKLGTPINIFSYPEGRFNDKIKRLVMEAGYLAAVATNPGKGFSDDDIYAFKRIRISSSSNNILVFWFETSGYYNFMRERRHK